MKTYIFYDAEVLFEANISVNGQGYLVIYGKHINGYFCCIPNWNIGCEMAEPKDTFYNSQRLQETGVSVKTANEISRAIRQLSQERKSV